MTRGCWWLACPVVVSLLLLATASTFATTRSAASAERAMVADGAHAYASGTSFTTEQQASQRVLGGTGAAALDV